MTDKTPAEIDELILRGKAAVRAEQYLLAVNTFAEVYGDGYRDGTAEGLSYYGLALALVTKKYRESIDLCRKAIKLQFLNPNHYVNLAKVFIAAGSRKKAVDALEDGLKVLPRDRVILAYWKELGVRSRPPIGFLSRENPLNVALGKARARRKAKPGESGQGK